jgi:hypothetical protein
VNRILNLTAYDSTSELADAADEFEREMGLQNRKGARPNQAAQLVEIGPEILELFHCGCEPYASYTADGCLQTFALRDQRIKDRVGRQFESRYGNPPNKDAWGAAFESLRWRALDGPEIRVGIRVLDEDNRIWLDLGNDKRQVIEITASAWRVLEAAQVPVRFVRTPDSLPLPVPQPGGSLAGLRALINVDDVDFPLVCGWLCGGLRPSIACAAMVVTGAHRSAKTTLCRILRRLIDPSRADMLVAPTSEEQVMLTANNQWVLALENMSTIPAWFSDTLCCIVTGAARTTRKLYTNSELFSISLRRPVIINSIADVVARGDLADRCLNVTAQPLSHAQRLLDADLWGRFEQVWPQLLGGLLDCCSTALRRQQEVSARPCARPLLRPHRTRMATGRSTRLETSSSVRLRTAPTVLPECSPCLDVLSAKRALHEKVTHGSTIQARKIRLMQPA